MKVRCSECGIQYEQVIDSNDLGEPNLCCEHCVWNVSNNGEARPPHSCREGKALEKVA